MSTPTTPPGATPEQSPDAAPMAHPTVEATTADATLPPPFVASPPPTAHRRSTHTEPPRAKPRTALWIWTGAVSLVVLLVALVVVLQVSASGAYDSARASYDQTLADTVSAETDLGSTATADAGLVSTAQSIVQAAPDGLVDATARDGVSTAAATLSSAVDAAQTAAGEPLASQEPDKPVVFWEVLAATATLKRDTSSLQDTRTSLSDAQDGLGSDATALDQAADTLYASAAIAGAAFQAAHVDAQNDPVIAFLDALDAVTGSSGVDGDALTAMTAYASAASAVVSSEQEELASIAGPLFDAKMAVQQFARSIDGGVLVEFDWAPTVNGIGEGGAVSGYTTWNYDHGGHAVILLSDSVAELWPSDLSHNLVAHEVGHAISSKCPTLYDDQDQSSIEEFATAWAISMGYTGDGNGVSIYGQPSDALIASAATCR